MAALYLIAHVAGRAVAIESSQVESVVDIGTIVPVPGAGRQVCGLTALRSRVVTVIETRVALGLDAAASAARRAVVTQVDGHHYAILVDALEDVASFECLPLSRGIVLDGGWRAAARGIIERDAEPMLVLDLRTLIPGLTALAA